MKKLFLYMALAGMAISCTKTGNTATDSRQSQVISQEKVAEICVELNETERKGVEQCARLWRAEDGDEQSFVDFVSHSLRRDSAEKAVLFGRLEDIFEKMAESADLLGVALQQTTVQTDHGEPDEVDWIMSTYSAADHYQEDLYKNKVALITLINFPHYTLAEKDSLGKTWSRRDWAYARMGDRFTERMPAEVSQGITAAYANTDNYISDYNIYAGYLRTPEGKQLWPEDRILLSHWNLRDELKANYAPVENAHERQEMLYRVMCCIVRQEIPLEAINRPTIWCPYDECSTPREPDTRYEQVLSCFHALQAEDRYTGNTYIDRRFNDQLEIKYQEVEQIFIDILSSDEAKKTADIIRRRLGRELRPYDIWYDGFKPRSNMDEDQLSAETQMRYPTAEAYRKDIHRMLESLGWSPKEAKEYEERIVVEPARGSGHARPCVGRKSPARLRTRIGEKGMDYKGYNIAVHEMGHNVEEVTSLYGMDYWSLAGIPNDGFTEASAFLFQQRDLQLLGKGKQKMDDEAMLDIMWTMYEDAGVCLTDMRMWQWLYQHPEANAAELREATVRIAEEVWNEYFADEMGEKDSPILGIYSHMICYPLYLPGYPIGRLVQIALEEHLGKISDPKEWAQEYQRIYRIGRLTPNAWMEEAVGSGLSVEPLLRRVREIVYK